MADPIPRERLQPSLLDRLTDDEPTVREESREQRVLSIARLRECVLRDLAWLLNTQNLGGILGSDHADTPVAHSVLNYGIPDLAGRPASGLDTAELERSLRIAILDFEPRILKHTLRVRVAKSDSNMSRNAVSFLIEGELWAQPIPLRMYWKSEVDLESGDVVVEESVG